MSDSERPAKLEQDYEFLREHTEALWAITDWLLDQMDWRTWYFRGTDMPPGIDYRGGAGDTGELNTDFVQRLIACGVKPPKREDGVYEAEHAPDA